MTTGTGRRQLAARHLWPGYLVLALAPLAVYYALGPVPQAVIYDAASVSCGLALLAGVWLFRPRPALPWLLLAASALVYSAADVGWTVLSLGLDQRPWPSIVDVGYLGSYPLMALGFGLLIVHRTKGFAWTDLLDAGIIFSGLALLLWVVMVDPVLAEPGLAPVDAAFAVAYPIGDIVLLAIVTLLLLAPGASSRADRLFALSLVVLLVGDIAFARLAASPEDTSTDWLYIVHFAVWGAAGLHPSLGRVFTPLARRTPRLTPGRIGLLAATSLVAPIVVLVNRANLTEIDVLVVAVAWGTICLLTVGEAFELVYDVSRSLDRRRALEGELQRTSETLRAILDASPLPIIAVDREGRFTFWSKATERLLDVPAESVIGTQPDLNMTGDSPAPRQIIERALAGETISGQEFRAQTGDGKTIDLRLFVAPLRDGPDRVVGALAVCEDVRDRRRLEAELLEARKMESVGRLAGGVAHDFNNILTAIIGYADVALLDPSAPDVSDSLTTIRLSAQRAAELTRQLLAFGRRQILQKTVLAVSDVVLGMEPMLRRLIGEQVLLSVTVSSGSGSILADRGQLEQVIVNLALNGRDAMPGGGQLVIRTDVVEFGEDDLSRHADVPAGRYVAISVTDTGQGMDEAARAQVFEPFSSAGRGTGGLGLAPIYGIVRQLDGYVWVYSEPGRGTTFKLCFPALDEEPAVPPVRPPLASGTRILLVEDEPLLRSLSSTILRRRGFEVQVAADPAEALALAVRQSGEPIDLLLTDVVMPGMSGTELARRLRATRPELRVLLTSGYAEEVVCGGGLPGGELTHFLAKPFSMDDLCAAVLAAVEAPLPGLPSQAGSAAPGRVPAGAGGSAAALPG